MTTLAGLRHRHEHLVSGRELLREADRHLNGAMDSACGPWLNRPAFDVLIDDLFKRFADDAGKVECVRFARVLTQRALAQQEEAAEAVFLEISARDDPKKISEAEVGHQALSARLQHEAERRTPDREQDDG